MSKVCQDLRKRKPGKSLQADYLGSRKHAIHLFCMECTGGDAKEASICNTQECFLWPFRPGTKTKKRNVGIVPSIQDYEKKLKRRSPPKRGRPKGSKNIVTLGDISLL